MDSTTSIVRLVKLVNLEGKATYCTIWTISVYISLPSLGSLKLCWYWQDPDAPPLLLHKNFLPPYFLFHPFPLTSRCFCLILIWNYRKYEEKTVKHKGCSLFGVYIPSPTSQKTNHQRWRNTFSPWTAHNLTAQLMNNFSTSCPIPWSSSFLRPHPSYDRVGS